jgi:hypothetical protein
MADITQGALLPSTISTKQTQATVPEFYQNYLQDITNLGQNAITQGGVAGLSPLTQQAMNLAGAGAGFAGANAAAEGVNMLTQAGQTMAPDVVNQYMNPYTKALNDEMARLTNRQINEQVLPGLGAAAIGSGNFGSQRQAQVTGNTIRDIMTDLAGKQLGLTSGAYNTALTSAQSDLNRAVQAGQGLGTLATEQQQIGQGGLKMLQGLGAVEREQAQAQLDYPMLQATNFSKLLSGQAVPTGAVSQSIDPGQQNQFQNSPLMNVASIAALIASLSNPQTAQNAVKNVANPTGTTGGVSNITGGSPNLAGGATGKTGGHFVMADGGPVYNSYGVQVN